MRKPCRSSLLRWGNVVILQNIGVGVPRSFLRNRRGRPSGVETVSVGLFCFWSRGNCETPQTSKRRSGWGPKFPWGKSICCLFRDEPILPVHAPTSRGSGSAVPSLAEFLRWGGWLRGRNSPRRTGRWLWGCLSCWQQSGPDLACGRHPWCSDAPYSHSESRVAYFEKPMGFSMFAKISNQ